MDVVVAPGSVSIYTNGTDGTSGPGSERDVLPTVETCIEDGDVISATSSCLTDLTVFDGGVQVAHGTPSQPQKLLDVDLTNLTAPVLVLDGCGGEATIPLDVPPPAPQSLAVASDTDSITAMWGGPNAVVLTFGGGVVAQRCRTQTSPYVLAVSPPGPPADGFLFVDAQALDGPTTVDTELGTVRVWSGATTTASPGS